MCNDKKQYYLNNQTKTCELVYINHCARSINGHCVQCEQDFILLNQQNKSVICSPVSKKIDNCETYKSPILCSKCKSGFYIYQNGISCVRYIQKIDNCYEYQYKNENIVDCQLCNNGYVLSEDKKECIKYDEDSNCLIASNFYCQECKSGYIPKNVLFNDIPHHDKDISLFHDIFAVQREPYRQTSLIKCINSQPSCLRYEQKSIMEAEEQVDSNEKVKYVKKEIVVCQECKKYHYLQQVDEKKYVCNKSQFIQNCEVYQDQEVCRNCESGYFLDNKGNCTPVKKMVPNCKYYESETKCHQCQPEYFLLKNAENKERYAIENFFEILQKLNAKQKNFSDFIYQSLRQELETLYKNETIQQMNLGLDLNMLFGPIQNTNNQDDMENQHDDQTEEKNRILEIQVDKGIVKNEQLQNKLLNIMQTKSFKEDQLQSLNSISNNERGLLQYDNHVQIHNIYKKQKKILEEIVQDSYIQSLQCLKYAIQNCASYQQGKCIYCSSDYYLINNTCKLLENKVQQCKIYYSDGECAQCVNGYILYKNSCFRMNPIYNCEKKVFSEKGKCLLCKSGYYYDQQQDKCVENSEIQERKCLIFSSLNQPSCYLCDQNHFMGADSKCYSEDVPLTGTIIGHHQKLKDLI